jgi:hypothetical protein
MEAIRQAAEHNPLIKLNRCPLQFVALFLGRFGRFDLSDRCLVYFSVLHDPLGQFKELSSSERTASRGSRHQTRNKATYILPIPAPQERPRSCVCQVQQKEVWDSGWRGG